MDQWRFACPDADDRGVTLWMLNDRLEHAELERQAQAIHAAGIGAVIMRTYVGLRTEYRGPEWQACVATMLRAARAAGLQVYVQAGYMPSGIPDLRDEHTHRAVLALPRGAVRGADATLVAEDESSVYIEQPKRHVLDILSPAAVDEYLREAYERTWLTQFSAEFGATVTSVWVDEPHFSPPSLPWGATLIDRFRARWGYVIEQRVASLFRPIGEFAMVRHHYWRTVTELLLEGYFARVARWCEQHDVMFSGHLMGEDSLQSQIAYTGACMPLYSEMHLPGIDHLTLSLRWSCGGDTPARFVMTPKQCSSAAHQHGRRRVLAEMYGVSTQAITFADRKRIADWFFVLGITTRCLHGTFYSLRGRRKRIYVPHLSYQQPWWPFNRVIADYCARISCLLRSGRYCADVLVIHPVESAYCFFQPASKQHEGGGPPNAAVQTMNTAFARLSEHLMMIQRGFDYGDEHTLAAKGGVAGGMVSVGEMAYRVVVLPELATLRRETVELLTRFLDAGGVVVSTGALPTRIDGVETAAINALNTRMTRIENTPEALRAALDVACPATVRVQAVRGDAAHVWLHERRDGACTVLFMTNTSADEDVTVDVRIAAVGAVEEWDPARGTVAPVAVAQTAAETSVRLAFAPAESHLLVLDRERAADSRAACVQSVTQRSAIDAAWRVRRCDPNALTLDFCRLSKGAAPFGPIIPVIAVQQILQEDEPYEGPITLRFAFNAASVPARICAVIEDADQCAIRVNGAPVAYAGLDYYFDRSFLPVDITALVQQGENTLDLSLDFKPLKAPAFGLASLFANVAGSEIESVYLIGDFAVRGSLSPKAQRPESLRYAPAFTLAAESLGTSGDLVADGYPFFAGRIELSADVMLDPAADERVLLRLPGLEACVAHVAVNGQSAGACAWPPYALDVTPWVKRGRNTIQLTLTNTLRNLLGPHHRPLVEKEHAWGEIAFSGRYCRETNRGYDRWYNDRRVDTDAWTDDYYFVRFGLSSPPLLEHWT